MATNGASKSKTVVGALLAGSMLLTAIPATAQNRGGHDRYDRRHDGISAGEVIAGAVVIGGLAAILSSGNGSDRGYDNRGYGNRGYDDRYDRADYRGDYDRDWQRTGGSRGAIQNCVNAVERQGGRRDDINVTRITNVERTRSGYRIDGRVAVDYRNNGYAHGRDAYRDDDGRGRGYGRGYNHADVDDRGSFTCSVRYGRVDDVRLRGI
ncbi:MAG: hypothetical protein ACKOUM_00755 [Sphingopyxis sp.]